MSTKFRKPNQIIHPYHFGDPYSKATCLWLKGLPHFSTIRKMKLKTKRISFAELPNEVDKGEFVTFQVASEWLNGIMKHPEMDI